MTYPLEIPCGPVVLRRHHAATLRPVWSWESDRAEIVLRVSEHRGRVLCYALLRVKATGYVLLSRTADSPEGAAQDLAQAVEEGAAVLAEVRAEGLPLFAGRGDE